MSIEPVHPDVFWVETDISCCSMCRWTCVGVWQHLSNTTHTGSCGDLQLLLLINFNTIWFVDALDMLGIYKPSFKCRTDFVTSSFEIVIKSLNGASNPSAVRRAKFHTVVYLCDTVLLYLWILHIQSLVRSLFLLCRVLKVAAVFIKWPFTWHDCAVWKDT